MNFSTEQQAIDNLILYGCDEFDGMNCDDCTGWDGESRRCECGNHRVELLTSQNTDGTWKSYGSAY